jgi:hypothetical protein
VDVTQPFDDSDDEFDRYGKPERPVRPPGMSIFRAYFWNEHDAYLVRSVPWVTNVAVNFYWLLHPRRYSEAKRNR